MKLRSLLLALVLLSAVAAIPLRAQDPGALGGRSTGIFAEFAAANPGQGSGFVWGGSAGGYFQGRLLGLVLRGTAEPTGDVLHVYQATLGPRVAFDLPWLRIYAEATGGVGHSDYYNDDDAFSKSWGPAWQLDAGAEHNLLPHLRWRILEVAYGQIYVGPTVSPVVISTGFSLHL